MRSTARAGRLPALVIACAATLGAAPAPAPPSGAGQRPAAPLPAAARVRVELNQLLQLHHWLLTRCAAAPRPAYEPACGAYREVQEAKAGPGVWQFVNDACALGPDIKAVAARGASLPATMSATDAGLTRRILGALASAWPVYEANDQVELTRSLQRVAQAHLRQRFSLNAEPRVMPLVFDKMLLRPLDAPLTVFPVTHGTHTGDWGKTVKGYYLVQPMLGEAVTESLVHELTHVLESGQPAGEHTMMKRLHEAARMVDPATFEDFAHGLVVYNTGETLRRVLGDNAARPYPESLSTWLPIYEKAWKPYLDGAAGADETVAALVSALLSRGSSQAPAPR